MVTRGRVDGRVAVVTGGASGLGEATVLGLARDIAHAALWLASDDAGFVSGTALVVDGGLTTGSIEAAERGAGTFAGRQPLIRQAGRRGPDQRSR